MHFNFGCVTGSQTILLKEMNARADIKGSDVDPKIYKIAVCKSIEQDLQIKYELYDWEALSQTNSNFE